MTMESVWSGSRSGSADSHGRRGAKTLRRLRATLVRSGLTLSIRLLWDTLLSGIPTWLEWPQVDRPRVPEFFVSIVSVE